MKGINTNVKKLRRKIFKEIAKLAYFCEDYSKKENFKIEDLAKKIVNEMLEEKETKLENFNGLTKETVCEMLRLCMGLSLRENLENEEVSKDIEKAIVGEKYYELPLVNVIKSACNACSEKMFFVTNACEGCLARPCKEVCLKDAIYFDENGKSKIDQEKCIKCGRCFSVCPYSAIAKRERPCAFACGVDAIGSDENKKAEINKEKCVSCGSCIVACPFGAIGDKSQIFQLIYAIKAKEDVVACVAPAFVGQFGENLSFGKVKKALKMLGFSDVVEVSIGADLCSFGEAKEFVEKVPLKQPFMATSCCPAWSVMAKKNFKDLKEYISMELTPMAFTGRLIKNKRKNVKVAFIGPCSAKKLEAFRKSVRSNIDFVLTFEEVMGMFEAKGVNLSEIETGEEEEKASCDGRRFAVTNGVANAVFECVKKFSPSKEILLDSAQGLKDCKKMLLLAKAGKRNGYLLEGMACEGGCVGGPGTLKEINKATRFVNEFAEKSLKKHAYESDYIKDMEELLDEKN